MLNTKIRTVAFLNNAVSVDLALADLRKRDVDFSATVVILARRVPLPDSDKFANVLVYPSKPSSTILGQIRFLRFYYQAAQLLKVIGMQDAVEAIYIVNNDNLIAAHLIDLAEHAQAVELNVVVEGLMNFQDISAKNREGWRWLLKPLMARLLGFVYRKPAGHLSGAFEDRVNRVISFSEVGLKAPPDKIDVIPYPMAKTTKPTDPGTCLIALTGLAHWMPEEKFKPFAEKFIAWLNAQGFDRVLVKRHPHVTAGYLEEILPPHEEIGIGRSLEQMAASLEAATVIGTCCTALVTLKLIRPDLQCIDYGADYYCEHAYDGDRSVETLLHSAGVKIENYH
ncbi:hypothetical protein [Parasphingorhabdus sp.]|uniref:hypothetical protein n=1 Tax=Parasphingorhabdus sp. TaxID=2709688 RepID=UPI003A9572DB